MHQRFVADPEILERVRSKMFRGFPYLVTPIVPALYHLMLLPSACSEQELVTIAIQQVAWNRLKSCLALGERKFVYVEEDCQTCATDSPPYSTFEADRGQSYSLRTILSSRGRCVKSSFDPG